MRFDRLDPERVIQLDPVGCVRCERIEGAEPRHLVGHHLGLQEPGPVLVLAAQNAFKRWPPQPEFTPQDRHHQDGWEIPVTDNGVDRTVESPQNVARLFQKRLEVKPLGRADLVVVEQAVEGVSFRAANRVQQAEVEWLEAHDKDFCLAWSHA